jgi:hypothetical protein
MSDVFDKHNVQGEKDFEVQKKYGEIEEDSEQLDQKLSDLTGDDNSLVDTASAGITILPKTLELLLEPLGLVQKTIGGLSSAYPTLIPNWFATMLKLLSIGAIGLGVFRVLLGLNRV